MSEPTKRRSAANMGCKQARRVVPLRREYQHDAERRARVARYAAAAQHGAGIGYIPASVRLAGH